MFFSWTGKKRKWCSQLWLLTAWHLHYCCTPKGCSKLNTELIFTIISVQKCSQLVRDEIFKLDPRSWNHTWVPLLLCWGKPTAKLNWVMQLTHYSISVFLSLTGGAESPVHLICYIGLSRKSRCNTDVFAFNKNTPSHTLCASHWKGHLKHAGEQYPSVAAPKNTPSYSPALTVRCKHGCPPSQHTLTQIPAQTHTRNGRQWREEQGRAGRECGSCENRQRVMSEQRGTLGGKATLKKRFRVFILWQH